MGEKDRFYEDRPAEALEAIRAFIAGVAPVRPVGDGST